MNVEKKKKKLEKLKKERESALERFRMISGGELMAKHMMLTDLRYEKKIKKLQDKIGEA